MAMAVEGALSADTTLMPLSAGDALVDEAARTLSRWIESLEDSDKQDVWITGRAMAPREILAEIGARSALGRRVIRMFVRELTEGLGFTLTTEGDDE
jgi:hypothetical protein